MTNYDILKEYEAHQTPVPSYEELENMNKAVNECMAANIKLVEQNAQLKELLKKCKIYVENFIEGSTLINEHHISYILLQRIKEVLK